MENLNLQKEKKQSFKKYLIEGLSYLCAAATVVFLIMLFYGDYFVLKLIAAIISAALFVALKALLKSQFDGKSKKKNSQSWIFFEGLKVFIVLIIIIGALGIFQIFTNSECGSCAVYQAIGLGIIVLWACAFLSYFVWAVHFYNIALGKTDGGWREISEAKARRARGETYSKEVIDDEPKYNPYKDETFGLPGGTVRGMIAFTLLFGSISMLIVSIGMENQLDTNAMFWDQYEFFKTAFLMMIAFYFGSRSLEYLKSGNNSVIPGTINNSQQNMDASQADLPKRPTEEYAPELPQVDSMKDPTATDPKPAEKEPKPGESTFDPMLP